MISIGLDLSLTHTGFVAVDDKGKIISREVIKSKPVGDKPMDEICRIIEISDKIIHNIAESLNGNITKNVICIEGLAYMAQGTSLTQLAGLNYLIRAQLFYYELPFIIIAPTTLKKFITGSGKGDKDMMMMAVYKNYKFESTDNNECDAYSLAICGLGVMDSPIKKLNKPQLEVVNLLKKQL